MSEATSSSIPSDNSRMLPQNGKMPSEGRRMLPGGSIGPEGYKNQKDYLFAIGVLDKGREAIAKAKRDYRRAYLKRKKQEWRERRKEVGISLTNEEHALLKQAAESHNKKLPAFIKACTKWYTEQVFIVPDEDQVQELQLLLRRIGNNINQIAKLRNSLSVNHDEALNHVQQQVNYLEDRIFKLFTDPLNFVDILEKEAQKSPEAAAKIARLLRKIPAMHPEVQDASRT